MSDKVLDSLFDIPNLSKSELSFIINATFGVQINASDAKLVSDLQQRLIGILTANDPKPEPTPFPSGPGA